MNVKFVTLGCKTNQYETNAMEQSFKNAGYDIDENKKPDIYVVNTCSVTSVAERKSRQMIRRAKELNKDAIVVVCGCYSQVAKSEIEKIDDVNIIIGINEKNKIVEIVEDYIKKHRKLKCNLEKRDDINNFKKYADKNNLAKCDGIEKLDKIEFKDIKCEEVSDVMHDDKFLDFGTTTYTELTRAYIKIQDGCDRFCSYCIIPYARGRVRSRKPESIISEITQIASKGIKEVVITGIHIASYGKDFAMSKDDKLKNYRLIDLLEEINQIQGIQRIRLGSIEPLLITEEFVKRLRKLEKICHHFHLSLQSGCDETLKRMNRRYTTEQFKIIVNLLRDSYEDVNLTTDIIVGFPGETDEEFSKTYQFLDEIKFYKMHVFKYSPRKGTKAAVMPNQISGDIKEERSRKLIEVSDKNEIEYNKSYIGKNVEVLFEEEKNGMYKGHTQNYIVVYCKSEENLDNKIVDVVCENAEQEHIIGKIL